MEYLLKKYYKEDETEYEKEYERRISSPSKVEINFTINPYRGHGEYQLYFIPTLKMMELLENITKNDMDLKAKFENLPPAAQMSYNIDLITDELFSTNDLEGVRSSREEVAFSVKVAKDKKSGSKGRFESMAKSYLPIMFDKIENLKLPMNSKDVREIYENIAAKEVADDEKIDGEIFRVDGVDVKRNAHTIIHKGIEGHDKIVIAVEEMLKLLNDEERIPPILRVAIAHYIFGYIHPFYDGNGRTSRYINSLYLSKSHSRLTAISLSRSINNNSKNYYEIFNDTNNQFMRGELNMFIEKFLEYILDGQRIIEDDLLVKNKLISNAKEIINNDSRLNNDKRLSKYLYVIAQMNYFKFADKSTTVKELSEETDSSEQTTRHYLNKLVDLNILKTEGKRPIYYSLVDDYFE